MFPGSLWQGEELRETSFTVAWVVGGWPEVPGLINNSHGMRQTVVTYSSGYSGPSQLFKAPSLSMALVGLSGVGGVGYRESFHLTRGWKSKLTVSGGVLTSAG